MSISVTGNAGQVFNNADWRQNMRAEQTPQKAKDAVLSASDDPVKITFSKEGREYYRQKIQNTKGVSADDIMKQKEILSKLVMSAEDGMETAFHHRLVTKNSALDKERAGRDELMENCVSVYKAMYDEIKQGYAQGTREKWIAGGDTAAGSPYRRLTEEEELAALHKTFKFYSSVIDGYMNYKAPQGRSMSIR